MIVVWCVLCMHRMHRIKLTSMRELREFLTPSNWRGEWKEGRENGERKVGCEGVKGKRGRETERKGGKGDSSQILTSFNSLRLVAVSLSDAAAAAVIFVTSVQSNFAKGRIADLSPLAAANGFVRSWAHLIHDSLDPRESTRRTASVLV